MPSPRYLTPMLLLAFAVAVARSALAGPPTPGCGAAAVYFVLRLNNIRPASLAEVSERIGEANDSSSNIAGLKTGLARYGVAAQARQLTFDQLAATDSTAILLVETPQGPHFAIYGGPTPDHTAIRLLSPPDVRDMTLQDFRSAWKGTALLVDIPRATAANTHTAGPLSCPDARQFLGRFVRPVATSPEVVFHVTNNSAGPVDLGTPVTSCGCTAATIAQTHLLPGAATTVDCIVHDNGIDPGIKHYSVAIPWPGGAPLLLTFSAEYVESIDARPSRLYFGQALRRELPVNRTVTLHPGATGSPDLTVLSTHAAVPWLVPTISSQGVSVALAPEAPLGPFDQVLTIETSSGGVNIPVSGEILGEIQATPSPVILSAQGHADAILHITRAPGSRCLLAQLQYAFDARKLVVQPSVLADEVQVRIHSKDDATGPMSYPLRIIDPATHQELTVCALRFSSLATPALVSDRAPARQAPGAR